MKIRLDVSDNIDVSDELYEMLLYAFMDKAERLGHDRKSYDMIEWNVSCEIEKDVEYA